MQRNPGKDRNPDKYQSFGIAHRPKSEDGVVLPSCGGPRPPAIASLPPHTGTQRSYIRSCSSSDQLPAWQCITFASRPHWQYPWQTQQCVSSIYFFSPNGTSVYARALPSVFVCLADSRDQCAILTVGAAATCYSSRGGGSNSML